MRLAVLAACVAISIGAVGQGNPSSVTGVLSDPTGAAFAAVEIALTGIDVRDSYVARTGADGHYDFTRVAPGSYRVAIRRSGIVPIGTVVTVAAGTRQTLDIRTALQVQMTLGLSPASAAVLRKWIAGGQPPVQPLEWECTSRGTRCVAPNAALAPQPIGEIMVSALARLDGHTGTVEMTGIITTDGFLNDVSVSSATSQELAAAAVAEVSRLRWEPARLREVPAITSATLDVRF